jgi:molybdate transport system substrate-binding protein
VKMKKYVFRGKTLVLLVMVLYFSCLSSGMANAEVFAAAASTQPVMEKLAAQYEKDTGNHMEYTFAASGQLARQIEMGAPFDLYISANEKWARYLEEKGMLEMVRPVAECPLVLWHDSSEAPSLDIIERENIKVAIADPEVAPYGALAKKYLEEVGLYKKLDAEGRLVIGGDVLKAGLAAKSGGANVACLPLSIAKRLGGNWTRIPVPPQRIFGGIVVGRKTDVVVDFFEYLFSKPASKLFEEAGFEPVVN